MASLELVAEATQPHKGDTVDRWRVELDEFYSTMHGFPAMEPDEIFVCLSGFSARVSEMRTQLVRAESRRAAHFRIQEVDYFLAECERQFKLWSRVVAVRSLDQDLSRRTP